MLTRTIRRHLQRIELKEHLPEMFLLMTFYGLTVQEVADEVGRSRSMMMYYMDGRAKVPTEVKMALSSLLSEAKTVADSMTADYEPGQRMLEAISDLTGELL